MPAIQFDSAAFTKALWGVLRGAFGPLIQSASGDLKKDGFARILAELASDAIISGDAAMREEVKANVPMLLQMYRLRAINSTNAAIFGVLDLVMGTAAALLGPLGVIAGSLVPSPTPPTSRDPLE